MGSRYLNKDNFTVLYYNARSLLPKLDSLKAEVAISKPTVICIVESWLCEDVVDQDVRITDYCMIRQDK